MHEPTASFNNTPDIFKRGGTPGAGSFHTQEAANHSVSDAVTNSSVLKGGPVNTFDDAISQQRDPYILEKME